MRYKSRINGEDQHPDAVEDKNASKLPKTGREGPKAAAIRDEPSDDEDEDEDKSYTMEDQVKENMAQMNIKKRAPTIHSFNKAKRQASNKSMRAANNNSTMLQKHQSVNGPMPAP